MLRAYLQPSLLGKLKEIRLEWHKFLELKVLTVTGVPIVGTMTRHSDFVESANPAASMISAQTR